MGIINWIRKGVWTTVTEQQTFFKEKVFEPQTAIHKEVTVVPSDYILPYPSSE